METTLQVDCFMSENSRPVGFTARCENFPVELFLTVALKDKRLTTHIDSRLARKQKE